VPFTPFHFGPVLLVHGIVSLLRIQWIREPRNRLSILLLYVGSVIPDLQGLYSILFDSSVEFHGFSHTLVGALVYTTIICSVLSFIKYSPITEYLEFQPAKHFTLLILAIIAFHFLPDILIWPDMNILWPVGNYIPGEVGNYAVVAQILFISGLSGATMFGISFLKSGRIPI